MLQDEQNKVPDEVAHGTPGKVTVGAEAGQWPSRGLRRALAAWMSLFSGSLCEVGSLPLALKPMAWASDGPHKLY